MKKKKCTKLFVFLLGVSFVTPLSAYQGGTIKNHAHTTNTGDGGALAIGSTKLGNSALSSFLAYRRPTLIYRSSNTVTVETGINGTTNTVTVLFPDNDFRVTTATRQVILDISTQALLSGTTYQSGVRVGTATQSTWYYVFAVKDTNDSNFCIVADTNGPFTSNYANLNTWYGTNGWVYLGLISYGDGANVPFQISSFTMTGNFTMFRNRVASSGMVTSGIRLADGIAVGLTWNYATGTAIPNVPPNILNGVVTVSAVPSDSFSLSDAAVTTYSFFGNSSALNALKVYRTEMPLNDGLATTTAGAKAQSIVLSGFWDTALGVGTNPRL